MTATLPMDGLIAIALDAGRRIMAIRACGVLGAASKPDHTPVCAADLAAEAGLLEGLARLLPGTPVIAEESAAAGRLPGVLADLFVLVDPLDGTKEFLAGTDEFTVNIGIIRRSRPVAGVILAPARRRLWWADGDIAQVADVDADLTQRGAASAIHVRLPPRQGLTALVSRSHLCAETEALLAREAVTTRTPCGSSMKFCLIAEGKADLYARAGRTMEWDTAAGDAILSAAGGRVTTEAGPLRYGKAGAGFVNPPFVARGGAS